MQRREVTVTGSLVLAFGVACVLAVPSDANAYTEESVTARLTTPAGSGCIQLSSSLGHGDGTSPMTIYERADMMGMTASSANQCNRDLAGFPLFVGEAYGLIIKLHDNNHPEYGYFLCSGQTAGAQYFTPELSLNYTYPTPPCGPGYYALIACIRNVSSWVFPASGNQILGSYTTNNIYTDCNHSDHWHPAGVPGVSVGSMGPAVVL